MTHRISTIITSLALAGLAVFLGVLQTTASASALTGSGHGPGYLSDDGWWLGTYRLDDGAQGFCLQAGRPSPTDHKLDYMDGEKLGWFSAQDAARLAYISRTWAGTNDRLTAAAGQLATWLIAGLGGHTPEQLAARAGSDAGRVLARARAMVEEAGRLGSTGVHANTVLELAETGPGRVRVEVTVDRLTRPEVLAPRAHKATVTLTGATFADGSTTASVPTGEDTEILPTGTAPSVSVAAKATLDKLPYGSGLTVAVPRDDAQALLIAVPAKAAANASASRTGPSPLPFQPRVATVTSDAIAKEGASLTDRLTVTVDEADGLLPSWGVRTADDGTLIPIEAIVESRLLGPFGSPISPAPLAPADAPVVCTVETTISGTGDYETPPCTLPAPGHYVWVDRIDPARTPAAEGGERLRVWQSTFGVASEVTQVEAPVPPVPPVAELANTGLDASAAVGWLWGGGSALASGVGLTVAGTLRGRGRRRARFGTAGPRRLAARSMRAGRHV